MVSSSSALIFFSPKKKRYILSTAAATLIFLILLFTFFVFTKRPLDPTLSLYKDLYYSQSQTPPLLSSSSPQHSDSHSQSQKIDGFSTSIQTNISLDPNSDSDDNNNNNGDDTKKPIISDAESPVAFSSTWNADDKQNVGGGIEEKEEDKKKNTISESESASVVVGLRSCNMYSGKWVKDEEENYPIYKPGTCPYVDEAYDCQPNGRKDTNYLQWRWKPHDCDLPRFNAIKFLNRLRGKRLMLVGDSMNRNQFESLLCLLYQGLPNKTKMYEVHGYKITKGRGYYMFKFEDYNCTVEFVRSHFLVKEGRRLGGGGNTNPTLSIDKIDKSAPRWKRADILVFNTGHWWTHGKTARGKNYYKEGDYIYPHFDAVEAYRRALKTWANWIDTNINPAKLVFYRGYSSAHFRGGDWDSGGTCNGETEPIQSGAFLDNYPLKMKIVDEIIGQMKVPVVALNVTKLTNFRKDGHPSIYGKNVTGLKKVSTRRQDCSHWCLPGVPDAWNELIYATLLIQTPSSSSLPNHPS